MAIYDAIEGLDSVPRIGYCVSDVTPVLSVKADGEKWRHVLVMLLLDACIFTAWLP